MFCCLDLYFVYIVFRYKTFKDDDATEILDVDEEIQRIDLEELKEAVDEDANEFAGLNLEREYDDFISCN